MDRILDILTKIATSQYYKFLYVYLFIIIIFQPKIASGFATKETYKILNSILNSKIANENETVKEIKADIVRESELGSMYIEYFNYTIKSQVYFIIGLSSLAQLIILLYTKDVVGVEMNLSFLTMTISIIECNDNIKALRNMQKKIDLESRKLIDIYSDLNEMAIKDFVQEHILNRT